MNSVPREFYDSVAACLSLSTLRSLQKVAHRWPSLIQTHITKRADLKFCLKPAPVAGQWNYAYGPAAATHVEYFGLEALKQMDLRYIRFTSIHFYGQDASGGVDWSGPATTENVLQQVHFVLCHLSPGEKSICMKCRECLPFLEKILLSKHMFSIISLSHFGPVCEDFLRHSLTSHAPSDIHLEGDWPQSTQADLERYILLSNYFRFRLNTQQSGISFDFRFFDSLFEKESSSHSNVTLFVKCQMSFCEKHFESYRRELQLTSDQHQYLWYVNGRKIFAVCRQDVFGDSLVIRVMPAGFQAFGLWAKELHSAL
ncbi:hypothetical protein QR680_015316 [Steinernema hermaphroditum]|uniref:F-box domain-containing protein n=1 Tax=Steinernema hermaphroditum TaxID=289476 RepID=A0AA39LK10_9BILA|nr:hypothetical protein QR680_015316 [Steinernema hermaphroditum]